MTSREDRIGWDGTALQVERVYIAVSAVVVRANWCEGGAPRHVNYEDALMLLNKIPAHRSRLAGHEVEDVIQWLMQRAAEVKVRDA